MANNQLSASTSFDPRELRDVFGSFVTGVTVVTTSDASGKRHGVTANSFSSVSLDPPLVLWSQSVTSKSHDAFKESDHFAVHILADDQIEISNHFAKSRDDKFEGLHHDNGIAGVPIIGGCAAYMECTKIASYPGGDHVVFLGRVERFHHSPRRPLAFSRGKYAVAYAHDLGPVSLNLGGGELSQIDAVRLASEALPSICEKVGQRTLCLAVWGNHGPTAVRWEPSSKPVSQNLRTGLVMSISRSATGRAFAAFLPEDVCRPLIDEDLRSSRSSGEPEEAQRRRFDDHVAEARKRGLARATEPKASPLHQVAVNAFSAPVFGRDGMVLALSLTCEADRLDPDWDGPVPQALLQAARELSARLATP
jgi:flavin reductase (DIM6/NTAB) family NADH-FMN oxidoreductase RutF/DNA-binding IclR family transcriptional regulator